MKCTPASIRDANFRWSGLLLSRQPVSLERIGYWSRRAGTGCQIYRLAGHEDPALAAQWAQKYFRNGAGRRGMWNIWIADAASIARPISGPKAFAPACSLASGNAMPDSDWLESLFCETGLAKDARAAILHGLPPGPSAIEARWSAPVTMLAATTISMRS